MVIAASLGVIFLATMMLGGWGWAFRRVLRLEHANWPATITLGMGAVVFLGGVLNLVRLAHPWTLAVVAATGIFLAILGIREQRPVPPPLFVSLLIAAILIFTIATQLPPGVYNFHDDFQKYFAYAVRMLQTGTVFGSPLSAIGQQTLGAQTFLDGFVIAFFPIVYTNGVDAIFGLLLCLTIASQFASTRGLALLCVLSVFVINPQYVNVSTLYCGSALIMAIAMFSLEEANAAAVGLLYAALIAMKPTFIILAAIHVLFLLFASGWRWVMRAGGATAIFLSPWILLHASHYWSGLRHPQPPPPHVVGKLEADPIHLFSWAQLDFGATALDYTILVAVIGICGLLCFHAAAGRRMLAFCAGGVATYLAFVYVLSPLHAGFEHSIRYFCPIAIGLAPPAFGWASSGSERKWIPSLLALISLALFLPSVGTRLEWAVRDHSVASYAWLSREPEYIAYIRRVLTEKEKSKVKMMQEKIPAGEPILAWMNEPFYFDYRRNRIIDIDMAGIGLPWAHLPSARYAILDYDGYPTYYEGNYHADALDVGAGERKNAEYSLDFLHRFRALISKGQVLFDDGEVKVVKLAN